MIKKTILVLSMIALIFSCKSDDDAVPVLTSDFVYTQEEKDAEIARLKDYITQKGYENVQATESGLHYIIEQQGEGLTPEMDDTVIAHYETTNLETDEIIGSSNREENQYGQALRMYSLLKGVSEGFMLVNEGSVIRMFVPGYLAFGKIGDSYRGIELETNMMYKMELNIVLKN
ncbi:FKBP-type peptidyl-prolyl cis-trans isomerase [Aquimarina mytili]|uniref:Peptidyl-prolyl cis-trans isomerase n=1 Tax=Aquimarina mytili TaxID=874423 RepID=A0A937A1C5_9FLAO|nr:FKBP-type peptidyl-prolyl cis-trans isomerase [Aquimarina mytili]MBL0685793.1 hypothetical protein [Aquimarina mytili]